jgi:Na+/proline symporter
MIDMEKTTIAIYLIGLFLVINLILGLWYGRGVKDIRDYALGSRSWSTGALVMTYLATVIGNGYIFSIQSEIYSFGICEFFAEFGFVIFHFIFAFIFASKMSKFRDCINLGDMMNKMYGKLSQIFVGIVAPIHGMVIFGLQLAAVSLILEKFLHINGVWGIVASGIILVAYTALGGIRAVVATDILQFVMLILTFSIIASVAIAKIGGTDVLIQSIPKEKFEIVSNPKLPYYISFFLMTGVFQCLINEPARM